MRQFSCSFLDQLLTEDESLVFEAGAYMGAMKLRYNDFVAPAGEMRWEGGAPIISFGGSLRGLRSCPYFRSVWAS